MNMKARADNGNSLGKAAKTASVRKESIYRFPQWDCVQQRTTREKKKKRGIAAFSSKQLSLARNTIDKRTPLKLKEKFL